MRQYREAKEQHPDGILLFRLGDFYEVFFEDALVAAPVMGVTLTSRPLTTGRLASFMPWAGSRALMPEVESRAFIRKPSSHTSEHEAGIAPGG